MIYQNLGKKITRIKIKYGINDSIIIYTHFIFIFIFNLSYIDLNQLHKQKLRTR
jgi:hypothetical protein